jgi:hypothetical protein
MTLERNSFWESQIEKYDAVHVKCAGSINNQNTVPIKDVPDRNVWFETQNFGWICSKIDERGYRHFILKY